MKVDKVLVPLDGSPLAEMVLPTAIELLRDSPDATLILLRAVEALPDRHPGEAVVVVIVRVSCRCRASSSSTRTAVLMRPVVRCRGERRRGVPAPR